MSDDTDIVYRMRRAVGMGAMIKCLDEGADEIEQLRTDAERYRWLKANARRIDFAGLSWSQGCELDARIDAALGRGEG